MAAAMFSAMPSFRSKLFTSFPSIHLRSPFNELHKLRYRSLFFLGHDDLNYDNTDAFLKKHGIHSTQEHYANAMANVDMGIRMFFDGLQQRGLEDQSRVIITGDHAFPMGVQVISN